MRLPLLVTAYLASALMLGGCLGGDDPEGSARDGGSIKIGVPAVPTTLDPALATDVSALQALWAVYTPLLSYRHADGRDGTELVPGLARDLPRISEDGLTYVLTLRRGLRYGNGVAVRPGDFERAVNRVFALDSPLAPLYEGIASIEADRRSRKVRVTLVAPDPTFAYVLALPSSAPLPAEVAAKDLSERPPSGVGPYRILDVRPGRRLVLTRTRNFELPGIPAGHADRITITRAGSPASQVRAVNTGSLDLMQGVPPMGLLPEIRSEYPDRYREDAAATTVALVANPASPPLEDPAVRQAVGQSLDGEKLVRLYKGFLETSCNVVPKTVSGYREIDPCPYGDRGEPPDLIEARHQIERAGADNALVSVRSTPEVPLLVARYVVRALRRIGLDATRGRRAGARLRLERIAPLLPHPAAFLEPLVPGALDEQLDEAAADALDASDTEASGEAWAAVDERLVTEAHAAPLGSERRPSFFSDRMDTANCARFHPVFGIDLSGLCLK
jgi:peptide/nickel transport system substrate-binding protein